MEVQYSDENAMAKFPQLLSCPSNTKSLGFPPVLSTYFLDLISIPPDPHVGRCILAIASDDENPPTVVSFDCNKGLISAYPYATDWCRVMDKWDFPACRQDGGPELTEIAFDRSQSGQPSIRTWSIGKLELPCRVRNGELPRAYFL